MSLIKCPKCGEMFSDSYKACPFCEEDEAYYNGKVRRHSGRRAAESSRRRTPSILGPAAIIVLVLLAALVVWLIFGKQLRASLDGGTQQQEQIVTPDNSGSIDSPDDTTATPTVSLNRTVLVLTVGGTDTLKVNGTEDTVEWSSSSPTVASVTAEGKVAALAKGNAVITATVNGESVTCTVTVKNEGDTPDDTTEQDDSSATTKPDTSTSITTKVDVSKLSLLSDYNTTVKPNDGSFDISLPKGLTCGFKVQGTDMTATWSGGNSSIATVTPEGTIKTIGVGSTTFTIKIGSTEISCLMRVTS